MQLKKLRCKDMLNSDTLFFKTSKITHFTTSLGVLAVAIMWYLSIFLLVCKVFYTFAAGNF